MLFSFARPAVAASLLLALASCHEGTSTTSPAVADKPDPTSEYNSALERIPPLAPRSELETTAAFAERKNKLTSDLEGSRYKLSIPVTLGKCEVPTAGATSGIRKYVGLRYLADSEQLVICALDEVAIDIDGKGSQHGFVPTEIKTESSTSRAQNAFGATATIETTKITGKGIFIPVGTNARDAGTTKIPMKVHLAEDLHTHGARLVYDVELAPSIAGGIVKSDFIREADMLSRTGIEENLIGLPVRFHYLSLEDSRGVLLARFEFRKDHPFSRLLQVPDPGAAISVGDKTSTRYGELVAAPGALYFKSKKFFESSMGQSLTVHAVHQLQQDDVALVEIGSGGSAGYSEFALAAVSADGNARMFRLADADDEAVGMLNKSAIAVKRTAQSLIYDLGYISGKKRFAIFDGTRLTLSVRNAKVISLPEQVCKDVHEVLNACAQRQYMAEHNCTDTFRSLNKIESGRIWSVFHYPGMSEEKFEATCDIACITGERLPYSEHKATFCDVPTAKSN